MATFKPTTNTISLNSLKSHPFYASLLSNYHTHHPFLTAHFGSLSYTNFDLVLRLRDLNSTRLGVLTAFRATATRTTTVRPELVSGIYKCNTCGCKNNTVLRCANTLCTNRNNFTLIIGESVFKDSQRVLTQEVNEELENGAIPRTLEMVMYDEMVETVRPGMQCVFSGFLKIEKKDEKDKFVFVCTGIEPIQNRKIKIGLETKIDEESENKINFPLGFEPRSEFNACVSENFYEQLSNSVFPNIHGHSNIKKAILLMLVGGVPKDASGMKLRGDINILLVGDPGTAKSQFLKQTSLVLDRSVYASGKSASAAGLTASVVRDSNDFVVEAGALILADNGICCIDEFDKMRIRDRVAIHEAMEQQTITIAKAGIRCTLNARASVLGAANPVHGRYDVTKSLRMNVNLSDAIMSRFDLFFVIIDKIDEESDRNVSLKIIENHMFFKDEDPNLSISQPYPVLSEQFVRDYIEGCKFFKPKMTEEVKEAIKKKYLKLRAESTDKNYRMTCRHLESLIRLSEALARVHRDEEVRISYVEEAYRLMGSSLININSDVKFVVRENKVCMPQCDYEKVTAAIVYFLKTKENVKKEDLIEFYLLEVENSCLSEASYFNEKRKIENVLDYFLGSEGVLFLEDGFVKIHPQYDSC